MAEDEGVEGSNNNSATTALHEENFYSTRHPMEKSGQEGIRTHYIFTSQTIQCSVLCEFIEPHTVL